MSVRAVVFHPASVPLPVDAWYLLLVTTQRNLQYVTKQFSKQLLCCEHTVFCYNHFLPLAYSACQQLALYSDFKESNQ